MIPWNCVLRGVEEELGRDEKKQKRMRSTTQRPRARPFHSKKTHEKDLPPCPKGMSCPYINEYQHQLEFSHSSVPLGPPSTSSSPAFTSSQGKRLGGSSTSSILLRDEIIPPPYKQPRLLTEDVPHPLPHWDGITNSDSVLCGICGASVSLMALDSHMSLHEGSSSSSTVTASRALQVQQNQEYEESILQDILKSSAEDARKRHARQKQISDEERESLAKAREESIRLHQLEARDRARAALLPEPGAEYEGPTLRIRFVLNDGSRVTRLFRADYPLRDCFDYLRTLDVLCPHRFVLKEMVGQRTFREDSDLASSLAALGIRSNSTLVVVIEDDDHLEITKSDDDEVVLSVDQPPAAIDISTTPLPSAPPTIIDLTFS